ncbi:Cation transporter family protein [Teladorsagia circumcincta]|uniref:Cation transporter family protein n=1 Tax=Teladorsagia circumcincta TaxID=45464 RepID=A0A2G9UGI3_TELCI|nr:Cation transporter family protein [Teladorsagia circumcincta]
MLVTSLLKCSHGGSHLRELVLLTVRVAAMFSDAEDRLMVDLFRGYNSLVQPVRNKTELPMIIKIAMQLVLLINVDEKEQVMHTNVWLTLKWHDFQLRWEPKDYDGITQIRVAPDKIWLPDIVLFNNADGNYEVSFMCNALVHHSGEVLWVPPAIYKSSCIIDVEFFPFDDQRCSLTFGSWTYSRNEVQLDFLHADRVDFSEYATSSIWDMMDAPAVLTEDRSRIEFQVRIRWISLSNSNTIETTVMNLPLAFYWVNYCMYNTCIRISGEKMGLTMNVLLSIVVFLLLVSKILPPTSLSIPLVAKYLLLTFVLNIITILITVVICNIYFRSPITHRLPPWVRSVFLDVSYPSKKLQCLLLKILWAVLSSCTLPLGRPSNSYSQPSYDYGNSSCLVNPFEKITFLCSSKTVTLDGKCQIPAFQYRDDWKFVAMVVDRVLLYGFFGITLGGTIGILFSAPTVFERVDEQKHLQKLIQLYKQGLPDNDTYTPLY